MVPKLFLSQRLDALIEPLIEEIQRVHPMDTRTILVPNKELRQWLLLEIAKREGIAMGLQVITVEQFFKKNRSSLETFCLIYSALLESQDPELIAYLNGKKKRILDLAAQLSQLFAKYEQYPSLLSVENTWQHQLFCKLWQPQEVQIEQPIICFGIDDLPPDYWQILCKAPSLSIYLFSPCVEFWEDLCTDRERKKLTKACKVGRQELDSYLLDCPRNLANWGKIGRRTLQIFDVFESFEVYLPLEPTTLLKQIQYDLLNFKETKEAKLDPSIAIHLTGSSRLREIEALKKEILRLNIPYHEISVLAPDLETYVPLIEYVFGQEIPFRIAKFDIAPQSPFRQGLSRLLALGTGRWDAEEILSLFETSSFYRKRGWDSEKLELFRNWISSIKVHWGIDAAHRHAVLQEMLGNKEFVDVGSWEKGLDALLEKLIFLTPMQVNADLFEEFLSAFVALKECDLKGEKSMATWGDILEKIAQTFLYIDSENEADNAFHNHFQNLLLEMKKLPNDDAYGIEVVERFLISRCFAQMHASRLHAVRFAPIAEGALIPAKALFLIGMDEMSFPKMETPSSLDLTLGKVPTGADLDRYRFLQCLFSATDFLKISYGHLSADEGKPVGPSLLVQELMGSMPSEVARVYPVTDRVEMKKNLTLPRFSSVNLPVGEIVLSIHELRGLARHPWRFFLQKVEKIYLKEELEETFALQRGKLVRELFEQESLAKGDLPGVFAKAMDQEVLERVRERKEQLDAWQIEPFTLVLRENCKEANWEEDRYIAPPVELGFENLKVKLVGEIKQASCKGTISLYEDNIAGTLKIWPEALIVAMVLKAPDIWIMRNGKNRSIQNAEGALKAFIQYYFHCLKAPSPLLSDWADSILRKGNVEFAKKIDRGSQFEDPVMDWIFARADVPTSVEMMENWGPFLKETFQGLIDLYPIRGAHAKV